MSEARELILRALSRLVQMDSSPADSDTHTDGPAGANGEATPVMELSEEALLRAFEEAAPSEASAVEEDASDPGTPELVEIGEAIEPLDDEEPTVAEPLTQAAPEPERTQPPPFHMSAPEPAPEPTTPPEPAPTPEPEATPQLASETAEASAAPTEATDTGSVLLQDTLQALLNVKERDDIARVVLGYSKSLFERSALFVMKREMVAGWEGVGEGMTQKSIRAILIPLSTPSVFKTVYETKVLYYGGVPRTTVNDLFLNAIGSTTPPQRVIVLPFVLKGKVVCALYADGGQAEELSPRMIGQLYQLGRSVSGAFEQLILRTKQKQ